MLPMALSLGEGGEQNAPLGRAVIGGLLLATVATLFFVPVVFSSAQACKPFAAKAEPKEESSGEGLDSAIPQPTLFLIMLQLRHCRRTA